VKNKKLCTATEQLVSAKRDFLPAVSSAIVDSIKAGSTKDLESAVGAIMVAAPDTRVNELLRALVDEVAKANKA
tara:strand:+ start:201 stop:422 length:222 start_codon:yes stop_codon:yes gene_type:complete